MSDVDFMMATPGSDCAIAKGCTCPVMDNNHGRGYMGMDGVFVMSMGCPLHGGLDEFLSDEDCHDCGEDTCCCDLHGA